MSVSRRTILKSIGLIGLAATYPRIVRAQDEVIAFPPRWNGEPLGRITGAYMNARAEPSTDAEIVKEMHQDDLVRIKRLVKGQTVWLHNDLWLETKYGYLYSSFVQPMWYHLPNSPQPELGDGRWAELTVPYSDAYWDPDDSDPEQFVSRMYYSSTFRVVELVTGRDGKSWYRIKELYQTYYMRATHLRLIPDEDLQPLSPDVAPEDKWIEVNLSQQTLIAYEGDQAVFAHYVSSGLPGHGTPEGIHHVFDKRISERMVGGRAASEEDSDHYNLAGVPFVCYFTIDWVALHGCYWHNDYGQQRSHGCVNLPADAARWLWRWTTPYADLDALYFRPEFHTDGTLVVVKA